LTRFPLCCQLFDVCRSPPRTLFAIWRRTEEEIFFLQGRGQRLGSLQKKEILHKGKRNMFGNLVGDRELCTNQRVEIRS